MFNKLQNKEEKVELYKNISYFFIVMIGVTGVTYLGLLLLNLVPNSLGGHLLLEDDDYAEEYWLGDYEAINTTTSQTFTKPERIIIDRVGIDTNIEQPNTRDVRVLDQYLNRGAVYYPGSGTVEKGNMFVFGHSTSLGAVQNQAYKTFNGLEKLNKGDEITVEAEGRRYIYEVTDVRLLDAEDALITFDNSIRSLTLSTCNTFGAKQERWVVESQFSRVI